MKTNTESNIFKLAKKHSKGHEWNVRHGQCDSPGVASLTALPIEHDVKVVVKYRDSRSKDFEEGQRCFNDSIAAIAHHCKEWNDLEEKHESRRSKVGSS